MRWSTALALLLITGVVGVVGATAAAPVVFKKNHFEIASVRGWTITSSGVHHERSSQTKEWVVATASHSSSEASATIVRINFPNKPAWRQKKYYFDEVLRGLRDSTDGFVLESKSQRKLGRVPILDIRYRREHPTRPHVATRFIFFRTLTLIISAPSSKAGKRHAAKLTRAMVPHL